MTLIPSTCSRTRSCIRTVEQIAYVVHAIWIIPGLLQVLRDHLGHPDRHVRSTPEMDAPPAMPNQRYNDWAHVYDEQGHALFSKARWSGAKGGLLKLRYPNASFGG
jgi:hypothetical protein